jgi:hypothetical protein
LDGRGYNEKRAQGANPQEKAESKKYGKGSDFSKASKIKSKVSTQKISDDCVSQISAISSNGRRKRSTGRKGKFLKKYSPKQKGILAHFTKGLEKLKSHEKAHNKNSNFKKLKSLSSEKVNSN